MREKYREGEGEGSSSPICFPPVYLSDVVFSFLQHLVNTDVRRRLFLRCFLCLTLVSLETIHMSRTVFTEAEIYAGHTSLCLCSIFQNVRPQSFIVPSKHIFGW